MNGQVYYRILNARGMVLVGPLSDWGRYSFVIRNSYPCARKKTKTEYKEIVAAKIDPLVFTKNLAKHALRKEINSLYVDQISNPGQRDEIENNIKARVNKKIGHLGAP